MSKLVRRVVQTVAVMMVVLLSWFGWHLYLINGATKSIVWQTEEGGLTLHYFPLKAQATLLVGDDYFQGSPRTWRMTEAGASKRIVGAPQVPFPEELFADANIASVDRSPSAECGPDPRFGLTCSSGAGLVSIYADVSYLQRSNIVWKLEYACETDANYCAFLSRVRDLAEVP